MTAAEPLSDMRLHVPSDGVRIELVGAVWEHEIAVNGAELHRTSLNGVQWQPVTCEYLCLGWSGERVDDR